MRDRVVSFYLQENILETVFYVDMQHGNTAGSVTASQLHGAWLHPKLCLLFMSSFYVQYVVLMPVYDFPQPPKTMPVGVLATVNSLLM